MTTKSIEDYFKEPYARVLIPEDDGGFSAEILEFSGCYAQGETADEAVSNLENAARSWIEAALAQGQKVPEAFARNEGSGNVALRLPRSTKHKAVQMAEREKVSLNTFLVAAVEARLGALDLSDQLIERLEKRLVAKTAANVMARVIPLVQAWDEASLTAIGKSAATQSAPFILNNHVVEEVAK